MSLFSFKSKDKTNQFEGWYTRLIDPVNNVNMAIIFGVTSNEMNPHAFIQIANAVTGDHLYRAFDTDLFKVHDNLDTVTIGANEISQKHLILDIGEYQCNITFEVPKYNDKSTMSVLGKLPLECFQEVIFTSGKAFGIYQENGLKSTINAKAYMEKTYGHNFPTKWLWLQSQECDAGQSDITLSYGKIPVANKKVNGFFCLLTTPKKSYRFASYNLSRIIYESYKDELTITIVKPFYKLVINTQIKNAIKLIGPVENGKMTQDVFESLTSEATVTLYHKKEIIFETVFYNCGLENTMDK